MSELNNGEIKTQSSSISSVETNRYCQDFLLNSDRQETSNWDLDVLENVFENHDKKTMAGFVTSKYVDNIANVVTEKMDLLDKDSLHLVYKLLQYANSREDKKMAAKAEAFFEGIWKKDTEGFLTSAVKNLDKGNPELTNWVLEKKFELNPEKMMGYIKKSAEGLETMVKLENKYVGSVAYLHKNFGISDFSRIPLEVLDKQYTEKNNKESPYIVMVFADSLVDDNNAFDLDRNNVKNIFDQLSQVSERSECLLRVVQVREGVTLARTLLSLDTKYGEKNKISHLILSGHGSNNSILLGNHGVKELKSQEINTELAHRIFEVLDPKAKIVLDSCSTGFENGLAKKLADESKRTVISAAYPTETVEYEVLVSDGKIDLNAKFYGEKDTTPRINVTKVFYN